MLWISTSSSEDACDLKRRDESFKLHKRTVSPPAWYYGLLQYYWVGDSSICELMSAMAPDFDINWGDLISTTAHAVLAPFLCSFSSPVTELEMGWHESFNISGNHVELCKELTFSVFLVTLKSWITERLMEVTSWLSRVLAGRPVERERERETCLKTGTVAVTGEGTWLVWQWKPERGPPPLMFVNLSMTRGKELQKWVTKSGEGIGAVLRFRYACLGFSFSI